MTSEELEDFCTGKLVPTAEQYTLIAEAMGLTSKGTLEKHEIIRLANARNTNAASIEAAVKQQGLSGCGIWDTLTLVNYQDSSKSGQTKRFDFAFDDPEVISVPLVSSTCSIRTIPDTDTQIVESLPWHDIFERNDRGPYPVYRSFCPVTRRGTPGILSLLVKKDLTVPDGYMSVYIHNMKIGDKLGFLGYNQFPAEDDAAYKPYELNKYKAITMLVSTWGIAPMFQILDYALNHPNNETKFSMVYENEKEEDIIMFEELEAFKKAYPGNFDVVYTLTNPPQGWTGKRGPIDADMVHEQTSAPRNDPSLSFLIYVAGPTTAVGRIAGGRLGDHFNAFAGQGTVNGLLGRLKYPAEQVHKF